MSDAGALNIQKEPMDLSDLVLQCVDSYRDRLARRDISVDLKLSGVVSITADQRRLKQLLLNLLENINRYVRHGGTVSIVLGQTGRTIVLTVEDSGPGLESDQIERLFERFYRVEGGRSRSGGGSGLGLSICRNIVEAHGGSISAEHSALGGLKIRVSLPA
jgi:two-component system sensor histidine kinase BaeS